MSALPRFHERGGVRPPGPADRGARGAELSRLSGILVATTRAQRRSARTDEDDIALFLVPSSAPGLRVGLHKHLDLTRRVCAVELAGVSVDSEAMLAGGADLYRRLLGIGAVAIAADSLGGMERALEMAVEYSKVREQFGKPIGAYQAVQHAAAEIVADLEPARALVWYAAYALDALPAAASRAASMAKARMCEAFMRGAD